MTRVLVLHGPNLAALGTREPHLYGTATLPEIDSALRARASTLDVEVRIEQSNHEGVLVDLLESERGLADGCILNPGGLAHTSVVLADSVRAFAGPVIEVHLSNIHAREPYRRVSLCAEASAGVVTGLGGSGYVLALDALVRILRGVPLEDPTR